MKVELHESRTITIEASGKRGVTKAIKAIQSLNNPIEQDGFTLSVTKSVVSNCKTIK